MSTPHQSHSDRRATDPSQFAWIEALFDRVVDLPPDERRLAIEQACEYRPDLRTEVEALIAAHEQLARAEEDDATIPSGMQPGSQIGAYRLIERIGSGGMGEVFRAQRTDGVFDAEVAVKLTHSSIGSHQLLRRFKTERQILATLKHPNIVTLLDGGATGTGQAYLIMEYVAGVPITQHCRARGLSLRQRLQLFRDVAEAVHYAHRHAVVHRDLKPANIMVAADGVAKVVDFGIAKLLDDRGDGGVMTAGLTPGPLTPNYASPEQLRGLPITTSTDVYALGVVLYEVIAGVRPYETQGQTLDRVLEMVMHTEPARPSAVRDDIGQAMPYPKAQLRGDIDAIVLKAMHKDPALRYGSASELARDITRYLEGEPVIARPPSAGYVLRRFAARHRGLVAVTALALLAVLTAMGIALWQRQVARREQARAEQRLRDVRQLANALIFKIHDAVAPLPGSTPVRRTIVNEAIGYLERVEADSPPDDVPLQLELAAAYRRLGSVLGDPQRANLGDRNEARRMYEKARTVLLPLATPTAQYDVFAALIDASVVLSSLAHQGGSRDQAVELAREGVGYATRFETSQPHDARAAGLAARASFALASTLPAAEALPVWAQTLARYETILARDRGVADAQRNVALVSKYLAGLFEGRGDLETARRHYARALELDEVRLNAAPTDPRIQFDAAISFSGLAAITDKLGDAAAAGPLFDRSLALRRQLSEADPLNLQASHRLGYLLGRLAHFYSERNPTAAIAHATEAIQVMQRVFEKTGEPRPRYDLAYAWLQLGFAQTNAAVAGGGCRAFAEARKLYEKDAAEVLAKTDHNRHAEAARAKSLACEAARNPA